MARGNINNLVPNSELTPEQRKERAKKAGLKSAEARQNKKTLRETMEQALRSKNKEGLTYMQAGVMSTINKWLITGDITILNGIRDLIGEKPTDKVAMTADEETVKKMDDFFDFLKDKHDD